jgi:polysaccharide export outer membrane protein
MKLKPCFLAVITGGLLVIGLLVTSSCARMRPAENGETSLPTDDANGIVSTVPDAGIHSGGSYGGQPLAPLIKPGHVLTVTVFVAGQKELEEIERRVSSSGQISLSLVGTVDVNGMTCPTLAAKLRELYKHYMRDPLVDVAFVVDKSPDAVSPWGYVTVLGRVKLPGRINIPPTQDLGLSMAIQLAGGLDSSAKDTAIKVTRPKADGTMETMEVNLRAAASQGKTENDVMLSAGDIIYVPEKVF